MDTERASGDLAPYLAPDKVAHGLGADMKFMRHRTLGFSCRYPMTNLAHLILRQLRLSVLLSSLRQLGILGEGMVLSPKDLLRMAVHPVIVSTGKIIRPMNAGTMSFADCAASLRKHISVVISESAQPEVVRIDTARFVAVRAIMEDVQSFGNRTAVQFPRKTVGSALSPVPTEQPMSLFATRSGPQPAALGFVDHSPEPLFVRTGTGTHNRWPRDSQGGIAAAVAAEAFLAGSQRRDMTLPAEARNGIAENLILHRDLLLGAASAGIRSAAPTSSCSTFVPN